jgi:amino acid transporter
MLGAAGEVAGAAVWLSFLMAGASAALQRYSFGKFGARYPSAAGLFEHTRRGFGDGHTTGAIVWLTYVTGRAPSHTSGVRAETGARLSLLILAVATAGIALAAFLLDLIVNEPCPWWRCS